jgi:hypothetical protein
MGGTETLTCFGISKSELLGQDWRVRGAHAFQPADEVKYGMGYERARALSTCSAMQAENVQRIFALPGAVSF